MVPELSPDGHLPPGRYRCDLDEVRSRFRDHEEFTSSTTRQDIWREWERATEVLRHVADVAAVWFGGSYISSKPDPKDIDAVYIISETSAATARSGQMGRDALALFAGGEQVKQRLGLRVDSYVLEWRPNPHPSRRDNADWKYLRWRGYWDDLWQRCRRGPGHLPPPPKSALPSRGYLEVILDGFTI